MGYVKSFLDKWKNRAKGVGGYIKEKTVGGGLSRGNRTKADRAATWAFGSRTNSIMERVKAMATKMAMQLYNSLNKSAEVRGKYAQKRSKVATKALKKDVKNGLNLKSEADISKAYSQRMQGKDPLIEQQKQKVKAAERSAKSLSMSNKNVGIKKVKALTDVKKEKKELDKLTKKRGDGDRFAKKIDKAKSKAEAKTKACESLGFDSPAKDAKLVKGR